VRETINPVTGKVRCVPAGNVSLTGNCSFGATGPSSGYDNCAKGLNYKDGSNMPLPSCKTLSTSAHNYDATLSDAAYWGCIAE
jgi:hypothetical protein